MECDEIDARTARTFRRRKRARPGIHTDHEFDSRRRGALNHVTAQVVALANAVWHMKIRRAAAQFNRCFQNDDGSRDIHVVIAIDEDPLLAFDGRVKPLHRRFHSGHQIRRMQMGKRR